jgi:5'(3')-deoxyribonucleotidase
VFPGAQEAVATLHKEAEVIFVTAAMSGNPHWMWERSQWLATHFNVTDRNIVFTWAKHVVTGDVFVDDKLSNIIEWHTEHGGHATPVLWDKPHNRSEPPQGVVRTNSWDTVINLVRK